MDTTRRILVLAVLFGVSLFNLFPVVCNSSSSPASLPVVYVDPPSVSVEYGEGFTIQVSISGIVDLMAFDIKLSYDTEFLDAVDSTVDPFLNEPTLVLKNEINETSGIIWIAVISLGGAPAAGDGSLATITFQSTLSGECLLDLYDTFLVNATGYPISHATVDGSVVVTGITKLYIDPAEIIVLVGQVFTVDVKLENVHNLYGFAIGIGYDASCLEFVSCEFPSWNLISGRTRGIMWLAGQYPKSGSLTLLSLTFRAKLEGSSPIQIYHHQLATVIYYPPARDNVGWPITHTTEDGQCTIVSPSVDILPNMQSLASRLKYVTAFIELPLGYDINEIDVSTLLLNNTIPVDNSAPVTIGDHDDDGLLDLAVKFNGTEVTSYILDTVDITERFTPITLTVDGRLDSGVTFQGSDTITVMKPIRGRREGQLYPL